MRKILVLFVLLLLIGCTTKTATNQQESGQQQIIQPSESRIADDEEPAPLPQEVTSKIKEFNVKAFKFGFEPATITVNKGDTVKITITSTDVEHGFAIPQFDVNADVSPGAPATIE